MKSEIEQVRNPEYPLLKKHKSIGNIVMFTNHRTGICVFTPSGYERSLWYSSQNWDEENFELFYGVLRILN